MYFVMILRHLLSSVTNLLHTLRITFDFCAMYITRTLLLQKNNRKEKRKWKFLYLKTVE